jgi:hypothetical protein
MSEHAVHVPHSPHGPERGLSQWVAIFTAIIATLGAIVGHESSEIANRAILLKNEAVLKKTEAADQWSYYQAVSTKSHLMELAKTLTPQGNQAQYDDKLSKYTQQKDEIQAAANALEDLVKAADQKSAALEMPRQNLEYALALFQIAISVASVTVLTQRRWLFGVAAIGAFGALGFWVFALTTH